MAPVTAGAVLCLLLLGACADERQTVGPDRGVSVRGIQEDQYFHEGDYLGQRVEVSAVVTGVLGTRSIELAARSYGDDSLLVQSQDPVTVRVGQPRVFTAGF